MKPWEREELEKILSELQKLVARMDEDAAKAEQAGEQA